MTYGIHIDPATGLAHRNDHICNQQCRDLAAIARAERDATKTCTYCSESISWDEVFGWYHGDIKAGWNTSCADDENRAWPEDEPEPDVVTYIWDCIAGNRWASLDLTKDELRNIQPALKEVVRNMLPPSDHEHEFITNHVSNTRTKVIHYCSGRRK